MNSPVLIVLWAFTLYCLFDTFFRRVTLVLTRRCWQPYAVRKVMPECSDMATFSFVPLDEERTLGTVRPGQFVMLRIRRKMGWSEPHPFSVVSLPAAEDVCLCVKRLGQFTSEMFLLQPDDQVLMSGPYGVFCSDAFDQSPLCLIAGGAGITPFLSLLRAMRTMEKPPAVYLIWSVRTFDQAFALDELREMQQGISLELTILCSREFGERLIARDDTGIRLEAGRVNTTHLRLCVMRRARIYICGPSKMQQDVLSRFREMGISSGEVARENFSW